MVQPGSAVTLNSLKETVGGVSMCLHSHRHKHKQLRVQTQESAVTKWGSTVKRILGKKLRGRLWSCDKEEVH